MKSSSKPEPRLKSISRAAAERSLAQALATRVKEYALTGVDPYTGQPLSLQEFSEQSSLPIDELYLDIVSARGGKSTLTTKGLPRYFESRVLTALTTLAADQDQKERAVKAQELYWNLFRISEPDPTRGPTTPEFSLSNQQILAEIDRLVTETDHFRKNV
jgi:hypothetical protein